MSSVSDAFLPVRDLEGWPWLWARVAAAPFFWTRRQPFQPWFALIATVDCRAPRRLREGRPYVAPRSGQLVCYFNDAFYAYANNHGTAKLRLIKIGSGPKL